MPAVLLLIVAWTYVVLLMAVAEATSVSGSVLAALGIVLFYGALPLGLVVYLLRAAARRRTRRIAGAAARLADGRPEPANDAASPAAASTLDPDRGSHAAGDAITPERKKP